MNVTEVPIALEKVNVWVLVKEQKGNDGQSDGNSVPFPVQCRFRLIRWSLYSPAVLSRVLSIF
jgi:hypothetical protein